MRTQCCRENIDKVAQICHLDPLTVDRIKAVGDFCKEHPQICQLTTDAVKPLMDESDPIIQGKSIQKLGELLNGKMGAGRGNKKKRYTKKEVIREIKKVKNEIRRGKLAQEGISQILPNTIAVHHADFLKEYSRIEKGSVDCIITDPPYVKEWLDNYEAFAQAAEYVLKPGGFLITYIGHIHMDKILSQMTPYLDYYWILCLEHSGHTAAVHSRGVQCAMKPILVFQKPPKTLPKRYFNDVIKGTGREKDAHEWQQGEDELLQIFEPFTDPGDLVLDPFMGSGTTLAMAKRLGRRAIGFDIDPVNVQIVKGRVAA